MTKTPFSEAVIDKFYECKGKIDEQMRKNSVINRVKRQILDASRRHKFILKYELTALYYDAIHHLCFNIGDDETEFYKALKNIMRKVENQIDKKEMICALAQFCESHPAEISPGILYDYAERWHSRKNNLFSLIDRIKYKPFWDWMLKHKIEEFDLENIFEQNENSLDFEDIISWIASDKDYVEVFFEDYFDFFIDQILQYIYYTAENVEQITLEEVFGVICSALPKYEVKLLNYAYLHYLYKEEEWLTVNDFIYILNRMADYEYATGEEVFCCTGKNEWPDMAYDGSVDVVEDAQDIIIRHSYDMEVAEIVWILQNRFSVQESVINDAIAKVAIEVFDGGHLNSLVHNEKLAPLFQFPVAYNLFLFYFDDIVKKTAKYAFKELEEKYGIECEVVKI